MTPRAAQVTDAPGIAAVWTPVIRDTAATFNSVPKPVDAIADDIAAKRAAGQPFLVIEDTAGIAGFATYAQFRAGVGYARTMEHTIILAPRARGRGAGRALVQALITHARAANIHTLVAAISAENPGAITFHERLGFSPAGCIPGAGMKFGRLMDLVLLYRTL